MGMFDSMPQSEAPDPTTRIPQGMMTGQNAAPTPNGGSGGDPTTSHGKFNGTVVVEGKPVQVQNGIAQVNGKPYLVSDNGAMVVDTEGRLIGHIEYNKFIPVTQSYMNQMRNLNYVE